MESDETALREILRIAQQAQEKPGRYCPSEYAAALLTIEWLACRAMGIEQTAGRTPDRITTASPVKET